jgi:Ca-activated chloride channel family protein
MLILLPVVALLGLPAWLAQRRRVRVARSLGLTLEVQDRAAWRRRRWWWLLFLLVCLLLVLGAAGPRSGRGGETGVISGRDLVLVLDFSKSMLAEDMDDAVQRERWRAARAALHELVDKVRTRGGYRLSLVVFAGKPWVVCPLTPDLDHFEARLDEYTPLAPPPELAIPADEPFVSGTRIGAALKYAVFLHEVRFASFQDILLLSDGDDPAPDADIEIIAGALVAREAQIPVHVVGLGDPEKATTLILGEEMNIEFVSTKLEEERLKSIARRTGGEYLAARREVPQLAEWFTTRISHNPKRELPDDLLPQPRDRSLWFFLPAFVLLYIVLVFEK